MIAILYSLYLLAIVPQPESMPESITAPRIVWQV